MVIARYPGGDPQASRRADAMEAELREQGRKVRVVFNLATDDFEIVTNDDT